jgi:TIR domain
MNQDQTPAEVDEAKAIQPEPESFIGKAKRFLFGNDVFISYARKDATIYSLGLAGELTKRGLSCFLDQWGTPAGTELPSELVSTLKRSAMLVVLGTDQAAASKAVEAEIVEFKKTRRTIIPVSFDGSLQQAGWYANLIAGISIAPESKDALQSGKPSENVVSRIVNAENFTRRNKDCVITSG